MLFRSAFQQLAKGSVPTSPTDVFETAQALYTALTMPFEERHTKALIARQAVERNDLTLWIAKQIRDINDLLERSSSGSTAKKSDTEPTNDAVVARLA